MSGDVSPEEIGAATLVQFTKMRDYLAGEEAQGLEHAEIEDYARTEGFELIRLLLQDHFDLRATKEQRIAEVRDAEGTAFGALETGHVRPLTTIVGTVQVGRFAYRHRGDKNLYLADANLNLPTEKYSHGIRQLAAIESARGSFEEARDALERNTGTRVAKRQVEELAQSAAVDFKDFYEAAPRPEAPDGEVVVISVDGKGIVMRKDSLRPATAKAAETAEPKLSGRLSKGEKKNRKRMAELGAVYTVEPAERTAQDVMSRSGPGTSKSPPKAQNKWLTASVVDDAAIVIASVFDEAERRDPDHNREWVALVDGNNHQIDRIEAEADKRGISVPVVIDLIHVLEYLWGAAWCFFAEGDPEAEAWVGEKAIEVLGGRASIVAGAIRRKATALGLKTKKRKKADRCADYLLAKAAYLGYPTALAKGWPIATGIIEGACRHIVADRMDLTGSRWGLEGAESILKLRALRSNDDWEKYWSFHRSQQRKRVHETRYLDGIIPRAA